MKGESRSASHGAAVADLRSLLERRGLGSALRTPDFERPESAPAGTSELDFLLGDGLPRGEIVECVGGASSGCTTLAFAALAQAAARAELTAYVDASDSLVPDRARDAGVALERLLWIRCGARELSPRGRSRPLSRAAQAWKAAHLVASAGGFGLIVLDLIGLPLSQLRELQRRPWFGLRRAIAHGPTAILTLSSEHVTGSTATRTLSCEREKTCWRGSSGLGLRLAAMSIRTTARHQRRGGRGPSGACLLEAAR